MARPTLLSLSTRAGRALSPSVLRAVTQRALEGLHVCLCLHRVAPQRRPTDWQPALTIHPDELDGAVELLLAARPGAGWLTLSFDDGYADAVAFIAARAPRWPRVRFSCFVCPQKTLRRAGYRWDLVERALVRGVPRADALHLLDAPVDLSRENEREDLRALGEDDDFRLATVEEVRALQRLPNVTVGNHSNVHLRATGLADDVVRAEYQESCDDFTRLFGPLREAAFPFGTPRAEFDARHVAMWREVGDFFLWSTEGRPFRPEERLPRAVLPRHPVDGRLAAQELVAWVAARAVKFRVRGTEFQY